MKRIGLEAAYRTLLGLQEFRAYLAICLFMTIKKLPSIRLYWSKEEPLYHCQVILQLMTREHFELTTRCLHVENAELYISNPYSPSYDKLYKVRWMLNEICDRFKTMWSPYQQMTIDKGIYKGKYCLM